MGELEVSIATAVVAAILGAAVTYVTARRDLQMKFDESLRDLRLGAYSELWKHLEKLAKYGRKEVLSRKQADELCKTLRVWYFETGGLVLSEQTRDDYFALLDGIELVCGASTVEVTPEDDEFLRVLGSRLRSGMTRDVGTRRTYVFRGDGESKPAAIVPRSYGRTGDDKATLVVASKRRLWFGRRPDVTLPDTVAQPGKWDAARQELVVRVERDGVSEERLLLFEPGAVVEGPKGWRRGDTTERRPAVVWTPRE